MSSEISPQPRGRVVLGGAGGFMGSHLAERYRAQGREVVTIGRSGQTLAGMMRKGSQPRSTAQRSWWASRARA